MNTALRTIPSLVLGVLLLAGCANASRPSTPVAADSITAGSAAAEAHVITTRGIGKATGVPDTVTVVLGVQTQAAAATAALDANNSKAKALIGMLRGKGVAANDLRTSELSIDPTYADKTGQITGYQVTDTVQATLHDVSRAGALIDAAAAAVGDAVRVQQIGLSVGDDSPLRAQARAQAVTRAQAQAGQLATAARGTLGRIRSISEVPDSGSPITYAPAASASMADRAIPIQAGQQDVTVSVDVTYDIG